MALLHLRLGPRAPEQVRHGNAGAVIEWDAGGRVTSLEPVPGMPATVCHWTDRSPATVVLVQGPFVAVRGCIANPVPGHCNAHTEDQRYTYHEDPNAGVQWFRREDDGTFRAARLNTETGRFLKVKGGSGLILGHREAYRDPSF